jgi:hypothetical protein
MGRYDPNSITNVLSLGLLQTKFPITYDDKKEDKFFVETPKGILPFVRLPNSLYVLKPTTGETTSSNQTNLLQTVKENKSYFTQRQLLRA